MAWHTIQDTLKLTGKSRSQLYRDMAKDFVSYRKGKDDRRELMRTVVFNYIECDYSRWRRHSACCGLSPEQFEKQNLA
jgi:transposase InsO family protein